jgi:hypothetical protein
MIHEQNVPSTNWLSWANAAGLLLVSWVFLAGLSLQARPGADVVAVAFPFWWSAQQSFAAAASADAAIVRTTAMSTVIVVRPDGDNGLVKLRQAGAWLTVDPQAIAACLSIESKDI